MNDKDQEIKDYREAIQGTIDADENFKKLCHGPVYDGAEFHKLDAARTAAKDKLKEVFKKYIPKTKMNKQ
jgi:hypothetical protein